MGNVNLETWRLYEALEAGCIPIVESRLAMRYYDKLFPEFPVPQVRRWRQASRLIDRLLGDPSALQAKQSEIARWWQAEKIGLRAEVTRIVDQCFFGGTASTKMSRLVRPIAWLEMLRHQSPASATRRIALEWKKLVAGR